MSGYFSGIKVTEDYLLGNISCYDGQTLFRKYAFTYNTQRQTLLTQIGCEADASNKFKPLQFLYGDGQTAAQLLNNQVQLNRFFLDKKDCEVQGNSYFSGIERAMCEVLASANTYTFVVQKVKFDSYYDNDALIVYPNFNSYQGVNREYLLSHTKRYFYSKFRSDQLLFVYQNIQHPGIYPDVLMAGNGFIRLTSADIDGLPGEEIIKINNYLSNDKDVVEFNTYKHSYSTGLIHQHNRHFDLGAAHDHYGSKSVYLKTFLAGDFNGDGKMELFVIQVQNYLVSVNNPRGYLFDLSTGNTLFSGNVFTFGSASETDAIAERLIPIDFDGDGKTDLCHVHASGTDVYTFEVSSNGGYTLVKRESTYAGLNKNTFHNNDAVLLGDINGDGKTDFLVSPQKSYYTTNTTYVPCSNGIYNVAEGLMMPTDQINFENISAFPFPEDGYTASSYCPVTTQEYVDRGKQWTVYYAKGGTVTDFEKTTIPICNNEAGHEFLLQDMNEDGAVDLVRHAKGSINIFLSKGGRISSTAESQSVSVPSGAYLIPSTVANNTYHTQLLALHIDKIHKITYTRNDAKQSLLTAAVNNSGIIMQNDYARLNDGQYYSYSYSPYYQRGYDAVFPYENFEGPLWVTTATKAYYDETLLTSLSYQYKNAVIHKQGLGFCGFQQKTTRDERRGRTVTQTYDPYKYGVPVEEESPTVKNEYVFDVSTYTNSRQAKITLKEKTETDKLKGNSVTTSFEYDMYANPTKIETKYTKLDKYVVTNAYTHIFKSNYTYSLLREQSVTNTQLRGSSTVKTNYGYNGNYAVVSREEFFNGNRVLAQAWEYDQFGNVVLQKEKPYDHSSWINATDYTYDASGRHVTKITDPMQKETTCADFHISGKPQTITDYKGNITRYTYDAFGRLTGAEYPDGVTARRTMAWCSEGDALYSITDVKTGAPQTVAYYDAFNRLIKQSTQGFDGSLIYTDKKYDTYSRLSEVSEPYSGNAAAQKTGYAYDVYDRIKSVQTALGKVINYTYSGANVTESDGVLTTTKAYNARGQLMGISGSNGNISYTYRPDGQPGTVTLNNTITTTFGYDVYGRQSAIDDPAGGRQSYSYDSQGNITQQTDANGKTVATTYNDFGQPLTRTTPELSIAYNYTDDYLLSSVTCGDNAKYFTYDQQERIVSESETVEDLSFAKTYAYTQDKMTSVTYSLAPDLPVTYAYNDYGYLKEITAGNIPVWQLEAVNHRGQPTHEILGDDLLTRKHTYSTEGLLTGKQFQKGTATIQHQQYEFDPLKNILNERTNHYNITETFDHDILSQLKSVSSFGESVEVHYDEFGNITKKTDVGTYGYNVSGNPYAISGIAGYEGAVPSLAQQVSYTSFRRPAAIEEESGVHTSFTYNADWQRVKMEVQADDAPQLTRYYLNNNYEKDITPGHTTERLYIGGTAYHAPAVLIREDGGAWTPRYILRDHLGSITGIADEEGTSVAEYSYDPWGRLRDPQTLQVYALGQEPALLLGRGFTGHEHLPWHSLINMNARLYDPLLGRFLAPDPYVQLPDVVRSYNRYAYCMNNPLMYVDENGEIWWLVPVIVAAVFAIGNTTVHAMNGDIHDFWDGFSYFAQGAVTGFALGAAWEFAPLIPGIGKAVQTAMSVYAIGQTAVGVLGMIGGAINSGWNGMGRAGEAFLGNFYLDENNFFGGVLQGLSRHTWEMLQSLGGHGYTQARNSFGHVSRVDYLGGVTFATDENEDDEWGISLGNYVNTSIKHEITGDFEEYVLSNPMYMHEYGHTIDSRVFGLSYLFAIGIPSLISADKSKPTEGGLTTHKKYWTEIRANKRAKKYFEKYYGVDWNFSDYPSN
jgi:RHS repeat-associated protein